MSTIFYSVAGEGRGHATRARALVEELRDEHQVHLFASGDAYGLLRDVFEGTEVRLTQIPCLRFCYTRRHRLSYLRTAKEALGYLFRLPSLIRTFEDQINEHRPDLVITDFEPALPRAARRCQIPFLSVDHQHFLTVSDFTGVSRWLRLFAWAIGPVINWFYSGQQESIVSSFFFPPLKSTCEKVTQVGVMLRPEILQAEPSDEQFLLCYLRREVPPSVLATLQTALLPVKIYGLGDRFGEGNLEFCAIHERGFLEDLIRCRAVICTAGNQLVGESLYLRKPVLALPEQGNFEQHINAHFLRQSGCGDWMRMKHFKESTLRNFLERIEDFRARIEPEQVNGNRATLEIIRRYLPAQASTLREVVVA